MNIKNLTQAISVAPQLNETDVEELAALGFKHIINNRPDSETPDQPSSHTLAQKAKDAGITYDHLPVVLGQITSQDIKHFGHLLEKTDGPVLAFCRTGMRAVTLWAQLNKSMATNGLSDEALTRIAKLAGYDLSV